MLGVLSHRSMVMCDVMSGRGVCVSLCFFQAEDGIRDLVRSRGLGDVYKRQLLIYCPLAHMTWHPDGLLFKMGVLDFAGGTVVHLSLIHI